MRMRQDSDGQRTLTAAHERPEQYAEKDEEQAESDYLAPTRWWITSTFFPLLAATFGPVASGFNICALVGHWVLTKNPNNSENEGTTVPGPSWLYAVNAVSLAVALIANLSLLGHMSDRIRFSIAQPVTIIGFYMASVILIGLVIATPIHLQSQGKTLSQGFYYACFAAFIYFVIASLLLLTLLGVYLGKYSRHYKLTMTQRSLMWQTMTFVGYLLASAAVYSRIEGWFYLDAVYWVTVTLFTIGFGDFTPTTHLGRSLFFPFAVGGILFVGLIVASISSCVLEAGSKKISTRTVEKARQAVMRSIDSSGSVRVSPFHKKRNVRLSKDAPEIQRREHEFKIMRLVQRRAAWDNALIALTLSVGMLCFLWFIGAVVFWQAELGSGNWSYFESLYFTYVAFLTVGYGDFEPTSNSAKPAFVFWALLALPTLTVLIGAIGNTITETVNTITLWFADHISETTPGFRNLKHSAQKMKKGKAGAADTGGDHGSAKPDGFMEADRSNTKSDDAADPSTSANTNTAGASALAKGDSTGDLSSSSSSSATGIPGTTRALLLLHELRSILPHLDASPPRKYDYAEWCYILSLLGCDENSKQYHRSVEEIIDDEQRAKRGDLDADAEGVGVGGGNAGDVPDVANERWSWLGRRSPLMSGMDEPRWVLEHLMQAMEKELRGMGANEDHAKQSMKKIMGDAGQGP